MGKGTENRARSTLSSATFTIFESSFANRRASLGGIGVLLSSIGCTAFILEHPAVLVYILMERRCLDKISELGVPLKKSEPDT